MYTSVGLALERYLIGNRYIVETTKGRLENVDEEEEEEDGEEDEDDEDNRV